MKSVYTALKKLSTNYLKKGILKEGVKGVESFNKKIKTLEIENKINIISNR